MTLQEDTGTRSQILRFVVRYKRLVEYGKTMWLDLVRGSLVDSELKEGKVGEAWGVMGPHLKGLLEGDIHVAELLNDQLKGVWESSKQIAKGDPQAERSIGGNTWRALVWASLSILSTTGNELPILGKMSKQALPDWIRDRVRVSLPFNQDIYQDPTFIMLKIDVDNAIGGVASPESLKELLERSPELVTEISVLWCKTQFSDTIKEFMLWSQIGQFTQKGMVPAVKHCFVTVPNAAKAERLTATSIKAKRVKSFDGGAYWGIGEFPGSPMKGVFDIIPNWRDRIPELSSVRNESLLFKRLGLVD